MGVEVLVTWTIIMGGLPVPLKGMKPESIGLGIPAIAGILEHGFGNVDCVTVWFFDMKLNWTMSYLLALTLSGE